MNYKKALEKIGQKVSDDFAKAQNAGLIFHSIGHTRKVVSRARKIGKHYQLEHEPAFILLAAAWFHDNGYLSGEVKGHEKRSAEIAVAYLAGEGFEDELVTAVARCILATELHENPEALLEQILCDADLYHLGTKSFFKQNKLIKKETEKQFNQKIPKQEWLKQSIAFLEAHRFHTAFCQEKLEPRKQKNLQKLRDKLEVEQSEDEKMKQKLLSPAHEKKKKIRG